MAVHSKWQSLPTEAINPDTLALDKLAPGDIVEHMLHEDRKMLAAVQREKDRIAVGIDILTSALRHNGRIVFVGAGTSGRLGVLESSEMPPTFGTKPELVQAIMAGGKDAMLTPREGVDDNYEEGARSINRMRPSKKDVVVGVSASGMTQFVRGALTRARRAGSKIIFVTCDPRTELQTFVDLTIAPGAGERTAHELRHAARGHADDDVLLGRSQPVERSRPFFVVVLDPFPRAQERALPAGHDRLHQVGARAESRRHLGRLEHAQPAARARADEDDAPAVAERLRDDLDADRDPLLLLLDGREHLAILVDHAVDNLRRRELVDGECPGINRLGRKELPLRADWHSRGTSRTNRGWYHSSS